MLLENSQNSQENTCARVSFLIELQACGLQLYQKRDSGTGVLLWKFYKISKNTFFTEHFWETSVFIFSKNEELVHFFFKV